MIFTNKEAIGGFTVGDRVIVTPKENSIFENEFSGIIVDIRSGLYPQVRDMEDNVWDCDVDQLSFD